MCIRDRAKSLASQAGIDIGQIKGSGDFGRIVKKDIELFIQNPKTITSSATGTSEPVVLPDFQYGDVPVSQMLSLIHI